MAGPEAPYMYDAPSKNPISVHYSTYDPKIVTKSWDQTTRSSRPTSTQSGTLVDFNRHPDSYLVVTGSDLKFKTMPSNTKRWVVAMRWLQFTLRTLQLFGAGGALFCAICLTPFDVVQAWIMRITPGYDLLITLYAIYHLIRSSTARTPGSSASYHFFALIMDAGLIPFYAFIAVFTMTMVANTYNNADPSVVWNSFFSNTQATIKLTLSFFYVACALAGMHLISLGLDMYLIIIFKKIASLPPDMNPLEDNLTSRKSSKHKYKNSELSLPSSVPDKNEKFYSGSTLNGSATNINGSRVSMAEKIPETRQIAFGHSRAGSDMSFSPHNPKSARMSKQQYDQVLYQQLSARESAVSVGRPQSFATANSRAASPVKGEKKNLTSDNWYVLDEEKVDIGMSHVREIPTREPRLPNYISMQKDAGFVHQPLAMNPPTPSIEAQQQRAKRSALEDVSINRSGTVTSDATITSSVYSESAPSLTSNKVRTPKSKYYGDLAAATRGVRGYAQIPQSENSPQRYNHESPVQSRSPNPVKRQDRVVSRSGADIADETMTFIPEKTSRRRMVSGKVAEEGRAGGFWY